MNKKLLFGVILGVFVIAFATAGLVSHFAKVQSDINVTAPLTLEQSLFTFDETEILNDGQNHYLLIKGENNLDVEVPATAVITIKRNGQEITDNTGLHLAIDSGGDMHYCYDSGGNMTGITNCDIQYVEYLENNNEAWFDWLGTDATYELSGFESPIINHGGNSWTDGSHLFVNGVLTLPGIDPDPGIIAALLVVKADFGIEPGEYTIEVELKPTA